MAIIRQISSSGKRQKTSYAERKLKAERALAGEGLYEYRNRNKNATLNLPKPTEDGQKTVPPNGTWEGDNYFMSLVRSNEATLVREIISPQQEREEKMTQEKLLLDQPELVTEQGQVEHVVENEKQKQLNETKEKTNEEAKKLLVEAPLDGVEIMLD